MSQSMCTYVKECTGGVGGVGMGHLENGLQHPLLQRNCPLALIILVNNRDYAVKAPVLGNLPAFFYQSQEAHPEEGCKSQVRLQRCPTVVGESPTKENLGLEARLGSSHLAMVL
jgi:hypothetical protein